MEYNKRAIAMHNCFRKYHGAKPLKFSKKAMESAQKWAEVNANQRKMYHSKSS